MTNNKTQPGNTAVAIGAGVATAYGIVLATGGVRGVDLHFAVAFAMVVWTVLARVGIYVADLLRRLV